MPVGQLYFRLPEDCTRAALHRALIDELGLSDDGQRSIKRDYLDSFDWRIAKAGYLIETEASPGGSIRLTRRSLDPTHAGVRPVHLVLPAVPRTAEDINASNLKTWLGERLGLRALTLVAHLEGKVQHYSLRDEDGKQRVRIAIQRDRMIDAKNTSHELPRRLMIETLRGYETDAERLFSALRSHCKLKALSTDPFHLAVAANGRVIGDYDQKVNFDLNPNQRTDVTAREILLALLTTMERNEDGIVAQIDTEFLHDYRVAVRRSRSLVSQVKGVFPPEELARFKADLGWLGQATGPGRDMDVYLLDFDKLGEGLPEAQREHLAPLKDFLKQHHAQAYRELGTLLRSKRYKTFRRDWHRFLSTPPERVTELPNAMRPIRHVADERIWRLYRLALTEGGAITPDSPNDDLHELRKTCKKLRYLLEFFRSLYPPRKLDANIRALKKLQDFLGLFQDLEVQSHKLNEFEARMRAEGTLPAETGAAIEALVTHMLTEQTALRGGFATLFAHFASAENQSHYRELFAANT
ncbi:MAG: CHAD domain-containing protein [Gammaproteobacteria bacterium]|nr:CHAD domain-containing protein [Gammaproteobacteria bacterium]MCP5135683.1 CHAD domain-containing protein [Gammaproteobacteria bacterium]